MATLAGGSGALVLAAEQVNICPPRQEAAVGAVVGVEEGDPEGEGGGGATDCRCTDTPRREEEGGGGLLGKGEGNCG